MQSINLPAPHDRPMISEPAPDRKFTTPGGKLSSERLEHGWCKRPAEFRGLHHQGVPHDESRDQVV